MVGLFTLIIGLGTFLFMFLAFNNVIKPAFFNGLGNTIVLPEKRDNGIIFDGKFGDVVKIIERTDAGEKGVIYKVSCERGEETRRYNIDEIHPLSKKQVIAGSESPVFVTTDYIKNMLEVNGGKDLKDSEIVLNIINRAKNLITENDDLLTKLNTYESHSNLDTDVTLDKMAQVSRAITTDHMGGSDTP